MWTPRNEKGMRDIEHQNHPQTWPSGKLPFECKKIAKNLTFFQKNCQKLSFFSTKLPMAILLKKMTIFGNFFEKISSFWQFFLQSNDNFPEGQLSIWCLSYTFSSTPLVRVIILLTWSVINAIKLYNRQIGYRYHWFNSTSYPIVFEWYLANVHFAQL